jgi:hypothetical protein
MVEVMSWTHLLPPNILQCGSTELPWRQYRAAAALFVFSALCAVFAPAQSMEELNLQVHGYATQGFIYSTNNNWDTTESTDGSAAWTEAVVNLSLQPESKLRIGVQARYYLLGDYGNAITLDWAQADYKVNERIGFRVGKVKVPIGLLNSIQDIDPAYLWVLLPQSIYPIASRSGILAVYGGSSYGTATLPKSLGKLDYSAYGGELILDADDGYLQPLRDSGEAVPNGLKGPSFGGSLHWRTPIHGLMVGATETAENVAGDVTAGPLSGTIGGNLLTKPYFFASYDDSKLTVAGEYSRVSTLREVRFTGIPLIESRSDQRSSYVMVSYKFAAKLTGGLYYSSSIDLQAPVRSSRFQKDWAFSSRYDFNPYLYIKLEQHLIDGTEIGYSTLDNADGLKPRSKMTLLKFGASF